MPKTESDRIGILRALDETACNDQAISIQAVPDGGSIVVKGMSELHLQSICDRLSHEHRLQFNFSGPEAVYLETIRKVAEAEGKYVRAVSRIHLHGHARLRLMPLDRGAGYEFVNETTDAVVPPHFVQAINLGIQEAMRGGILAGNEIVDVRAVLCGGSYLAEDSSDMAFKIAGSMAFKEAARNASPVLLEPMMAVKVEIPEEYAGTIMGDLTTRRALIKDMESRDDGIVIVAEVPLAEMFGYAPHLCTATKGRGSYSLDFSHYEELPWREDSGADEIGVTANKPRGPRTQRGSAAEHPNTEM